MQHLVNEHFTSIRVVGFFFAFWCCAVTANYLFLALCSMFFCLLSFLYSSMFRFRFALFFSIKRIFPILCKIYSRDKHSERKFVWVWVWVVYACVSFILPCQLERAFLVTFYCSYFLGQNAKRQQKQQQHVIGEKNRAPAHAHAHYVQKKRRNGRNHTDEEWMETKIFVAHCNCVKMYFLLNIWMLNIMYSMV